MSAFLVHAGHIDYLVSAALACHTGAVQFGYEPVTVANADACGRMLWRENVASVSYRYPRDTPDALPGPIPYTDPGAYTFRPYRQVTIVQALKAVGCYEYQSCEHPGWEESDARTFCVQLQSALIARLPGYAAAPWTIEEPGDGSSMTTPRLAP